MKNFRQQLCLLFTLLFIAFISNNSIAQGAMQEGVSVYRAQDLSSRTGSSSLTVTFDRNGNAIVNKKEVNPDDSDVLTLYLFVPSEEVSHDEAGGNITVSPDEMNKYWVIDFGSASANMASANTLEVSCSCNSEDGECEVKYKESGDQQQWYCKASGCSDCKMQVINGTNQLLNSQLFIKANAIEFE